MGRSLREGEGERERETRGLSSLYRENVGEDGLEQRVMKKGKSPTRRGWKKKVEKRKRERRA